jgi:hypothetical protein
MNPSLIASIVRHLLGIGSGWLLAKGIDLDAGTVETIAGAIGSLVAVGWSIWSKRVTVPAAPEKA